MSHHGLEILMRVCSLAMSLYVHRLGQILISVIKTVDVCEARVLLVSLQRHLDFVLSHPFQLLHADHVIDCKAHLRVVWLSRMWSLHTLRLCLGPGLCRINALLILFVRVNVPPSLLRKQGKLIVTDGPRTIRIHKAIELLNVFKAYL